MSREEDLILLRNTPYNCGSPSPFEPCNKGLYTEEQTAAYFRVVWPNSVYDPIKRELIR